jgi:hypothetical protein
MPSFEHGNISEELLRQRLRDSPYHKLLRNLACSKQIQNPLIEQEKAESHGNSPETD